MNENSVDSIRTVRTFAAFLGQSLDQAEPEDLRRFESLRVRRLLHMGASSTHVRGFHYRGVEAYV
jgi:hypothetical protein